MSTYEETDRKIQMLFQEGVRTELKKQPKTKLYGYQRDGVDMIEEAKGRTLICDQMGLGKSLQALAYMFKYELYPAIIICPAFLKVNWQREVRQHLGMRAVILEGRKPKRRSTARLYNQKIIIINYDILAGWIDALLHISPQIMIVDECFPKDTIVITDQGELTIGEIVEGKLPVKVLSFDKSKKCLVFSRVLHYIKTQRKNRMVFVFHSGGMLRCTEDHKIWTENRGYVEAINLQPKDTLRMVRKEVQTGIQLQKTLLQSELCYEVEASATTIPRNNRTKKSKRKESKQNKNGSSKSRRIKVDESKQPLISSRSSRKDTQDKTEKWNSAYLVRKAGWKWPINKTTNKTVETVGVQMENGVCNSNRKAQTKRHSNLLQSRHRKKAIQTCNRNRWPFAQLEYNKKERPEENKNFELTRVERVEIQKQANRQIPQKSGENDTFVYCLEVETTHNFFANDILVSNCQYCKNLKTKRTICVRFLSREIRKRLFLSGTPMSNNPAELFPVLNMLWRKHYRSPMEFAMKYARWRKTPHGIQYQGPRKGMLKILHAELKDHGMIRRLKKDVLKDLPEKRQVVIPLPMSKEKEYRAAESDFLGWLRTKSPGLARRAMKSEQLVRLGYLRRLAAELKMKSLIEWVHNFLEESDEKLALFGIHHKILDAIDEEFRGLCVLVTGKTPQKERWKAVDQFQLKRKTRLFIGNCQAAGLGINLTAASNGGLVEIPWTPPECLQVEDRLHRIGQEKDVLWRYFITEGTIEEDICRIVQKKHDTSSEILDGSKSGGIDWDIYEQVSKRIERRSKCR